MTPSFDASRRFLNPRIFCDTPLVFLYRILGAYLARDITLNLLKACISSIHELNSSPRICLLTASTMEASVRNSRLVVSSPSFLHRTLPQYPSWPMAILRISLSFGLYEWARKSHIWFWERYCGTRTGKERFDRSPLEAPCDGEVQCICQHSMKIKEYHFS